MKELVLHALRERPDTADASESTGNQLEQSAQGLGMDIDRLRAQRVAPVATASSVEADVMEVWPELWVPLMLFLSCRSQFELKLGMGVAQWAAARAVNVERHMAWLGIRGRRRQARVWVTYRRFEAKAIDILNKRLAAQLKRNHHD